MADRDDSPVEPNSRSLLTFYCRDCEQCFLSEPDGTGFDQTPCPSCKKVCLTLQFEEEERARSRAEAEILSIFAGFLRLFHIHVPEEVFDEASRDSPDRDQSASIARDCEQMRFSQLGEMVRRHYDRSAFKRFETDEGIWRNFLAVSPPGAGLDLLEEVELLLELQPKEAFETVNNLCATKSQTFITPIPELIAWLTELRTFLKSAVSGIDDDVHERRRS